MKILIIGGTNFIGPPAIRHLTQMGHEVTIFHRGKTTAKLPAGVNEIIGERKNIIQIKDKLQQLSPEVVLDMIAYTEHDVRALSEALQRTINWQRANTPQQPAQFAAPYLLDYAVEDAILETSK